MKERTGFTNVRPDSETAERKRGASVLVSGLLERALRADEEMSVADRDYLGDVVFHAVDDSVVAKERLAYVAAPEFPDDAAGKRKVLKMLDSFVNRIAPFMTVGQS